MHRLWFYITYAVRNVWRTRRWSSFAMLSVGAGVATVVALHSLGLAITDALTADVRATNHGDITIAKGFGNPLASGPGATGNTEIFTDAERQVIREWALANDATIDTYTATNLQVVSAEQASNAAFDFVTALFIDPTTFPIPGNIVAATPASKPLEALLIGAYDIVISANLANNQGIGVGDGLRVSGTEAAFVVRGIVPSTAEANLRDPLAAFFGFVYFHQSQKALLSIDPRPNRISLGLPAGSTDAQIDRAANQLDGLLRPFTGEHRIVSVPSLRQQNTDIAGATGRLVLVIGLGAMLLGGVGIVNTMLVMVRRRTHEIAALKTFGLQGHQVAVIFMIEALLLGFGGSVLGIVAGLVITLGTSGYGEALVLQSLSWRVYPQALALGMLLGIVVTVVFGVLPVLAAAGIRPAIILRPNETHLAVPGGVQATLGLAFVLMTLGFITGQIIGPLPPDNLFRDMPVPAHWLAGLCIVLVTALLLALILALLWGLVWLIGRLPALGSPDLRLVFSNLSAQRTRTATTLLALSVGMFALSSIAFYSAGMRELLGLTLAESLGGNVLILSPATTSPIAVIAERDQQRIDARLNTLEAVQTRTRLLTYEARLLEVDTRSLRARPRSQTLVTVSVRDTDNPDFLTRDLSKGRGLTLADRGRFVAVVRETPVLRPYQIDVGSSIVIRLNNTDTLTFEVIGLVKDTGQNLEALLTFGDIQVPPDTLTAIPESRINTVQVDETLKNEVLLDLSTMVGVYPIDVAFIDRVFRRLVNQFAALPLLVGLLSLMAAAVIMANTVALATLERRKQIGVLKAVGLGRWRILGVMTLENVLICLLGSLSGIGLSALGMVMLAFVGRGDVIIIPADARPVALTLIAVAVLIGAGATVLSAWPALREHVILVLRDE